VLKELPDHVQEEIERLVHGVSLEKLTNARFELSRLYREGRSSEAMLPQLRSNDAHLAYVAFRLPATYAVLLELFSFEELNNEEIASLLDFGAGPATSLLAALNSFATLKKAFLVERDREFMRIAENFLRPYQADVLWKNEDMKGAKIDEVYDLTVLSYSLGELDEKSLHALLEKAWNHTGKFLVIVEPGTPLGYKTIIEARGALLSRGAHIVAPCPHAKACPLEKEDWCHFSCRLPRSRLHRLVKGGSLGFEDEKYSYLILRKNEKAQIFYDRIIKPVQKSSGMMKLELCSHTGCVEKRTIAKRDKEAFSKAKKKEWGDSLLCE
jgi:ribosomal protein RSM22 (predicted rRNA methylase)